MDLFRWNLGGRIPSCPPWCGYHGNGTLYIQQLWASGGQMNQFCWNLTCNSKLGPQWQSCDQILKFLKFKMADGRHVGNYSKCHNSPTNWPTVTQFRWSHPIMFSTCPPWCGCHDDGRCLVMPHSTFCSYGRLKAERVNQFWWNSVRNSKFRSQWQSHNQILQFLKFKMADGRRVKKYSKYHNSPTNWLTVTQLRWSYPTMFSTCPPWCGCHGNGRCLATAHWTFCSYGHLEAKRVNQFCWNLVRNSKLGPQLQSRDQILKFLKFKMADGRHVGKYSKCHNSPTDRPTGTQLGWSYPIMFLTCPSCCGCHGNGRCLAMNILQL